jgi:hypothetical protein
MYAQPNIVARSPNVYTSLGILEVAYHFTRVRNFYGDFVSGNSKLYSGLHINFRDILVQL